LRNGEAQLLTQATGRWCGGDGFRRRAELDGDGEEGEKEKHGDSSGY
jgi:hypothetical protein